MLGLDLRASVILTAVPHGSDGSSCANVKERVCGVPQKPRPLLLESHGLQCGCQRPGFICRHSGSNRGHSPGCHVIPHRLSHWAGDRAAAVAAAGLLFRLLVLGCDGERVRIHFHVLFKACCSSSFELFLADRLCGCSHVREVKDTAVFSQTAH